MTSIFEKILNGEIPADIIYEDDYCLSFNDINPKAPIHCLIIPKTKIVNLKEVNTNHIEAMGNLMLAIPKVANIVCPEQDFRIISNNGINAGQTVFYMHIHLLSGEIMAF